MLLRQARGELDFYPRPPGGGRLSASARFSMPSPFLSTPSGWRATEIIGIRDQPIPFLSTPSGWRATSGRYSGRSRFRYFYPRPPGGGRLSVLQRLRVFRPYFYPRPPGGGRRQKRASDQCCDRFLSTPSGWRATERPDISIRLPVISIHALRVEGDEYKQIQVERRAHFYPRPPGGGRPRAAAGLAGCALISIHALRVEGDASLLSKICPELDFYPRPPGGGRQQKRTKFSSVFAQKGEEIASLRRGKRKFAGGVLKRTNFGF